MTDLENARQLAAAGGGLAGALAGRLLAAELAGRDVVSISALRTMLATYDSRILPLEGDGERWLAQMLELVQAKLPAPGYRKDHDAWVIVLERSGPAFMNNVEVSLRLSLGDLKAPPRDDARRECLERLHAACEAALGA